MKHGINARKAYTHTQPEAFKNSRTVPGFSGDIIYSGWGRITEMRWCELEVKRLALHGIEARVYEEQGMVAVV